MTKDDLKIGMKFQVLGYETVYTIQAISDRYISLSWEDILKQHKQDDYCLTTGLYCFNNGRWLLLSQVSDKKDTPLTDKPICTCHRRDLFNYGCRCGAFHKELAMIKKVGNI